MPCKSAQSEAWASWGFPAAFLVFIWCLENLAELFGLDLARLVRVAAQGAEGAHHVCQRARPSVSIQSDGGA